MEGILAKHISHKGLASKTYENHLNSQNKKTNNTIEKWANDLNGLFTKEVMYAFSK